MILTKLYSRGINSATIGTSTPLITVPSNALGGNNGVGKTETPVAVGTSSNVGSTVGVEVGRSVGVAVAGRVGDGSSVGAVVAVAVGEDV